MDLKLFVLAVFAIAVVTVGVLQWLKGLWKKMPSQFAAALLPVICLGLGWAVGPEVSPAFGMWLLLGGLAWAIGQLCYELIVQSIPALVQTAVSKAEGAIDAAQVPKTP